HVTVVGDAGTGKSRLLWEFFKYLDGIEDLRFWHEGRCLSYGEGVAYWALAEMVRSRAGITEEEPPEAARAKLAAAVERVVAEGIPLYAVETVRMLQDRGLLVAEDARYVVAGDVTDLEVPETLHALVASRLDGLLAEERSLLQDASVLGQTFSAAAVAALSGR